MPVRVAVAGTVLVLVALALVPVDLFVRLRFVTVAGLIAVFAGVAISLLLPRSLTPKHPVADDRRVKPLH